MSDKTKPPDGAERRSHSGEIELRSAPEGSNSPGTIFGYAAKFGTLSCDFGGYRETLAPGAFRACMGDDVRCLRNHEDDLLLGRSAAGTLRYTEDETGLRYECDLPNTTAGRDTAEMIRSKNMTGCSFQFVPDRSSMKLEKVGPDDVMVVNKIVRLYDVGPVTFPAYEDTHIDMRSLAVFRSAKRAADEVAAAALAEAAEAAEAEVVTLQSQAKARVRVAKARLIPLQKGSTP